MLKPNIIDIIEDPPYDMIGKGAPTIGSKPNTIAIFTKTYKNKEVCIYIVTTHVPLGYITFFKYR